MRRQENEIQIAELWAARQIVASGFYCSDVVCGPALLGNHTARCRLWRLPLAEFLYAGLHSAHRCAGIPTVHDVSPEDQPDCLYCPADCRLCALYQPADLSADFRLVLLRLDDADGWQGAAVLLEGDQFDGHPEHSVADGHAGTSDRVLLCKENQSPGIYPAVLAAWAAGTGAFGGQPYCTGSAAVRWRDEILYAL